MKLKKLLTVISTGVMILCCSCSENKEQEKDMSFAVSPEIMICRVIDAIASNDQWAYCKYYPDSVSSYNQSFDDIYENYAMQCREFGVDYECRRTFMEKFRT